jgi:hypothetical protein
MGGWVGGGWAGWVTVCVCRASCFSWLLHCVHVGTYSTGMRIVNHSVFLLPGRLRCRHFTIGFRRHAVCVCVCVCVCMWLCVCLSICMSVCLYVCISVCLFVCLSVCLYVCLSVCVCVFVPPPWPRWHGGALNRQGLAGGFTAIPAHHGPLAWCDG